MAQFHLQVPSEVIEVVSSVTTAKAPVGVETSVLQGAFLPGVDAALSQGRDIYAALGAAGVIVTRAEDCIGATEADAEISVTLSVAIGAPLLQVVRRVFTVTGHLAETSVGTYLPGAVSYSAST